MIGCQPAPTDSRLAGHSKIAVRELTWSGWEIPPNNTMCGDGMPVLLSVGLDALTCTSGCDASS